MGIPYSKQINAAFDEVTPLVNAGFQVLQTSKNISILLAVIQILNFLLLVISVLVLVALLITVNPDLEEERRKFVTSTTRWLLSWLVDRTWLRVGIWTILVGGAIGGCLGWYITQDPPELREIEGEGRDEVNSNVAHDG